MIAGAGDDSSSSSDSEPEGMTPFQRVVHRDAYKRALVYPKQIERYAGASDRLDAIVDQMKLWVKNTATEYDPKKEVQTFVVTVFPKTPIKELRVRRTARATTLPVSVVPSLVACCSRVPALQATIFETLGFKPPVTRFGDDSDDEVPPPDEETAKLKRLKLIYRGLVLEDGKVFDDYEWKKERWKWSKPYAGAAPWALRCAVWCNSLPVVE